MSDDKQTPHTWERAIDKQIREAMERGEFDNLRGTGKPLTLDDSPNTPTSTHAASFLARIFSTTRARLPPARPVR
jgi:hypothetical protein